MTFTTVVAEPHGSHPTLSSSYGSGITRVLFLLLLPAFSISFISFGLGFGLLGFRVSARKAGGSQNGFGLILSGDVCQGGYISATFFFFVISTELGRLRGGGYTHGFQVCVF